MSHVSAMMLATVSKVDDIGKSLNCLTVQTQCRIEGGPFSPRFE
jgi:hypothetical protein